MKKYNVIIFKPYPFKVGQKLHIDTGSRYGEWAASAIS